MFRGITLDGDTARYLVIADLHIGYELELQERGINMPRQTEKIVRTIAGWIRGTRAEVLAILGDLKHELPYPRETIIDVAEFLRSVSSMVSELIIVPGNHDTGLDKIMSRTEGPIQLTSSRGMVIRAKGKRVLLLHGHTKPAESDALNTDMLVMGHTHPAVTIRDVTGYTIREPIIVKMGIPFSTFYQRMYRKSAPIDKELKVVILPASNHLITGTDISNILSVDSTHTILTYMDIDPSKTELYLTDFTYIGTLAELGELFSREKVDWERL